MELIPIEVAFELAHLCIVGINRFLRAVPSLVNLLYDDLGVAVGKEPLDAEGGRDPETVDEGLVLGRVVCGLKE